MMASASGHSAPLMQPPCSSVNRLITDNFIEILQKSHYAIIVHKNVFNYTLRGLDMRGLWLSPSRSNPSKLPGEDSITVLKKGNRW